MISIKKIILFIIAALIFFWWFAMAPPKEVSIETYHFKAFKSNFDKSSKQDYIQHKSKPFAKLIGQDDIVFDNQDKWAYVSTFDGRLWRVDIHSGEAEVFVDPPLMPAGLRFSPVNNNLVYFCASRYYKAKYPEGEKVGLYQLNIKTKEVTALVTQVPSGLTIDKVPDQGTVNSFANMKWFDLSKNKTLRDLAFCNDLDVSKDGNRIYFSEPFAYEGASMGGGAFYEAVSLGRNGKLWVFDKIKHSIALVAHGFNFIDGVLLEHPKTDQPNLNKKSIMESSVLITETTKFSLVRLFLTDKQPGYQYLWTSLPYMPDGLDRDAHGRIWTGLIKKRSNFMNWLHKNKWAKKIVMRIPRNLVPVKKDSAIMAFSPDAEKIIYYSEHNGDTVPDISTVVPYKNHLYLPSFNPDQKLLYKIPVPETSLSKNE